MEIYPKYLYAVTATAILLRMNIEPRQISTAHNTSNYLRLLYNIKQKTDHSWRQMAWHKPANSTATVKTNALKTDILRLFSDKWL